MSVRRIVRFLIGFLVAAFLMAAVLPFLGIPKSHFLPPSFSYASADGKAKGYLLGKYYEETSDPFHVGGHNYFVNYEFKAHKPPPRGATQPGPVTIYQGTIRVNQSQYDEVKTTAPSDSVKGGQILTAVPQAVAVKYVTSYPEISGIGDDRNIGPGSNALSGWIIWLIVAIALAYLFMIGFELIGSKENI